MDSTSIPVLFGQFTEMDLSEMTPLLRLRLIPKIINLYLFIKASVMPTLQQMNEIQNIHLTN
jgi:hypothetical protein